uniref:CAS_CSE1 domain-containing protein n=1 Tax=Parastrongyloides trichosuri TaxID=131310 RepID=A0A0N4Z724_PARTI
MNEARVQPCFTSIDEIIPYFKKNDEESQNICYKLYSNVSTALILELWDVLTKTYDSQIIPQHILGFTKQLHKFNILKKGDYENYKNLLLYHITQTSIIEDQMEINCLDFDFLKLILYLSKEPTYNDICDYFLKNHLEIQKTLQPHLVGPFKRFIKKILDEKRSKELYQYETKLRDDRLVYNELYTLYYHTVNDKVAEFEESLSLIEEQVNKYPDSIAKQMYLLSYIASQCLVVPNKGRMKGINLYKKLLSLILELVLAAEKNSNDSSVSKRIICVVTPFLQFIANSEKIIGYGDIFSRLIKVLIFLNNINGNDFLSLLNDNYPAFKNLADNFPGQWVSYLLGKNGFQSKFKNQLSLAPYKDNFDDSLLDSLYEPALNGFDVKGFKLKDSYTIYETMKTFRGELEEEMRNFTS